jgi:hypothetical protein
LAGVCRMPRTNRWLPRNCASASLRFAWNKDDSSEQYISSSSCRCIEVNTRMKGSYRKERTCKTRTICLVFLFLVASFLLGLVAGTTLGKISEQVFTRHFSESGSELVLSSFDEALDEASPGTRNNNTEDSLAADKHTASGLWKRLFTNSWWLKHLLFSQDDAPAQSKIDSLGKHSQDNVIIPGERNIAYFIQVSSSTIQRLYSLLDALYHPKNVYAIHLDKKIPETLRRQTMKHILSKFKGNVHFMESEPVTYRGISMVLNTIEAMKFLLDKDSTWDYFINLSGSDYPLVPALFIRKLFGLLPTPNLNFIQLYPPSEWSDQATLFRIMTLHFDPALEFNDDLAKTESLTSFGVQHPFRSQRNFTYVKSDFWSIFSREFCDFIVRDTFAKKMLAVFAVSDTPDEAYFATCAYNHPRFRSTIVPQAFRAVYFCHKDMNPACNGQHPFTMDEEGNEDIFWNTILYSKAMFARKFSKPASNLSRRLDQLRVGSWEKHSNLSSNYQMSVQCRWTSAVVPVLELFLQEPSDGRWRKLWSVMIDKCRQSQANNEILRKKEDSFVSISNFFDTLGTFYFQ